MRRSVVLLCAVVAVGAAVAFAIYAPTVLVAAPLWVMALCVITGCRSAPAADASAPGAFGDRAPERETLTVVRGGLATQTDRQRATG